jgi:hypothetical protein
LSKIPSIQHSSVLHVCNYSTWEEEAGELRFLKAAMAMDLRPY